MTLSRRAVSSAAIAVAAAALAVAALLAVAGGCAGTPNKRPRFIPDHVGSVYVFNFLNATRHRELGARFVDELEGCFGRSALLKTVPLPKSADAVVEGRVTRLFFQAVNRTGTGEMDRARWYLEVEFSFRDTREKTDLLTRETVSVARFVNFFTPPVADRTVVLEEMVRELADKLVQFCVSGERRDLNAMYGYENQPLIEDDGTLIGKERKNYDKNNDGIDDRYQTFMTNTSATNSTGR